ncbi:MAG: PAS domain-containing protein [Bacteroidia bacterium]
MKDHFLVCIGASAGGLDALGSLTESLSNEKTNFAVLVAQHLSPTHKSRMVDLIQKRSKWPVSEAINNEEIKPHHVYITPPDKDISVQKGRIKLSRPSSSIGPKPSVNFLFQTAAEDYGEKCVGIILSGTGSDGAIGMENIKTYNGYTMTQLPEEAQYDGMPKASIETGAVDLIGSTDLLYTGITQIIDGSFTPELLTDTEDKSEIDYILDLLAMKSGVSFKQYKQSTIIRRLESRLKYLKLSSLKKYITYINEKEEELDQLFNSVLIGVTQFFRDPQAFECLRDELKKLLDNKKEKSVRIWVTGCATGEEAYTIGIILSEILGTKITDYNIQIFATDIDENALFIARRGIYPKDSLQEVDSKLISKYFKYKVGGYEVVKSLRSMVLFSKHDLTTNPPFLKLDLISCRNLLIYFNIELQQKVIPIFHYALNDYSLLFLGKSETLGVNDDIFSSIGRKAKMFKKKKVKNNIEYTFSPVQYTKPIQKKNIAQKQSMLDLAKESIFDNYYQPFVIVDEDFSILYLSGKNIAPFLSPKKGPMTSNIFKYCENDIEIELRSALLNSRKTKKQYITPTKRIQRNDKQLLVKIIVYPVYNINETVFTIIIDSIEIEGLPQIKDASETEIEFEKLRSYELEQELNATKEHLQSYIEELETTNEEMQSLNEELQSSNEELQSANEELETSNEELQSTNEEVQIAYNELQIVNDKLRDKDAEITQINTNIQLLLNNNLQAFLLMNKENNIMVWNEQLVNFFFEYNNSKVKDGANLFTLLKSSDANFFLQNIYKVNEQKNINTEFSYVNTLGKERFFRLNFTLLDGSEENYTYSMGIIEITDLIEQEKVISNKKIEADKANQKYKLVFDNITEGFIYGKAITNKNDKVTDWKFIDVNEAFATIYGTTKTKLKGNLMSKTLPWLVRESTNWFDLIQQAISGKENASKEVYIEHLEKWLLIHFVGANEHEFAATFTDISKSKAYENRLKAQLEKFALTDDLLKNGFWELDVETEETSWSKQVYKIHELPEDAPTNLKNGIEFYPKPAQKTLSDSINNCIKHRKPFDLILPFRTVRGKNLIVRAAGTPILEDGEVKSIFGVFQDLTSEIDTKKEIEMSRNNMLFAQEVANIGFYETDLVTKKWTGSDKFYEIFGFNKAKEPFTMKEFENLVYQKDHDRVMAEFEEAIEKNIPFNSKYRAINIKTKEVIWVKSYSNVEYDADNKPIKIYGLKQNITDEVLLEEHLNERIRELDVANHLAKRLLKKETTKELIESVIELAPKGLHNDASINICIILDDHRYGDFNSDKKSLIINSDSLDSRLQLIITKNSDSQDFANHEQEYFNSIMGMLTMAIIGIDAENLLNQSERHLQKAIKDLNKSNKELEEFAYVTSHDLQEPLRMISSFTQLLEKRLKDKLDEQEQGYMNFVTDGTRRLQRMIVDLLKYSRINTEEEKHIEVDLNKLVKSITDFTVEGKKDIKIEIGAIDLPNINGSLNQLNQLFKNLVENAVKYRGDANPLKLSFTYEYENDDIIISISDNGAGIDKSQQERIFNIFQRGVGQQHTEGSGIGLALCSRIMKKHNGNIWVESDGKSGSSFKLRFSGQ